MKRDNQGSGHRIFGGECVVDPGSALVTDQRNSWRGQELTALLLQSQKLVASLQLFNFNGDMVVDWSRGSLREDRFASAGSWSWRSRSGLDRPQSQLDSYLRNWD